MYLHVFSRIMNRVYQHIDAVGYAKRIGVTVGEGCRFVGMTHWGSEPYLISIGNNVTISFDVAFVNHDGGTWTIRRDEKYKKVIKVGRIDIGDDCFVGCRSVIMPGVTVGSKSIIGACSLVNKNVPPNQVWGGGACALYLHNR